MTQGTAQTYGTPDPADLSTVVMFHPSRRSSADRVAKECQPLNARLIVDPEPTGPPSPLRTAKVAWDAVADGATHHIVLQDDVHLCREFATQVSRVVARFPHYAISLGVLWVSPYNSYRVREAATGGFPFVHLAPWEWVPSLGLVLPAAAARELAEFLRTFPDITRDDDEHIAVFCAKRGIPVVAPVPHLLDHSTRHSVAGNDHHGVRLAVAYVDRPIDAEHWNGPELKAAGSYNGSGFAVDLVESRCNLRVQRAGRHESAEQPFTWPWRPWSALVGIPEQAITDAAAVEHHALQNVPVVLAAEVWAAGFLLGAGSARSGQSRYVNHELNDQVETEALRTWLVAGLRNDDRAVLGADSSELLIEWLRRAVAAGRRYAGVADSERTSVERMAAREAQQLLLPAPEELPDIRLDVRECAAHADADLDASQVIQNLPVRYLAEHFGRQGAVALAALACEQLEPRALAGLARLAQSGWSGVVETRAAAAMRLRDAGRSWAAVLQEIDAAEERFSRADPATEQPMTLPASCRTHSGEFAFVSPHAGAALSRWDEHYKAARMRATCGAEL